MLPQTFSSRSVSSGWLASDCKQETPVVVRAIANLSLWSSSADLYNHVAYDMEDVAPTTGLPWWYVTSSL